MCLASLVGTEVPERLVQMFSTETTDWSLLLLLLFDSAPSVNSCHLNFDPWSFLFTFSARRKLAIYAFCRLCIHRNTGRRRCADVDTFDPHSYYFFTCVIECVPCRNCFCYTSSAAVSVVVGPCCPALLHCIDVDVHTVVLLGK